MKGIFVFLVPLFLGLAAGSAQPVPASLSLTAAAEALQPLLPDLRTALIDHLPSDRIALESARDPRLDIAVSALSFRRVFRHHELATSPMDVLRFHLSVTPSGASAPLYDDDVLFPVPAPATPASILPSAAGELSARILRAAEALPPLPEDSAETTPKMEPTP